MASFANLQILAPTFPGGFEEMNSTAVRSLEFFYPTRQLDLVVVLDDTVYNKENLISSQESITQQAKNLFPKRSTYKNLTVAYNPRSDEATYGRGWYRQQLIMLWADNFTNAEYVGFIDDDTVFTRAVQAQDLFDSQGRPRALREHLEGVRQAMNKAHPEYSYFDELYVELLLKKMPSFSQFTLMFDHLWRHHREDYKWHFEYGALQMVDGKPQVLDNLPHGNYHFRGGTPAENGVSNEMLLPFPRVAVHANYIATYPPKTVNRTELMRDVLRRGYCFSLPLLSTNVGDQTVDRRCDMFDVWSDINVDFEWDFESSVHGKLISAYNHNGTLQAHRARLNLNSPKTWDEEELRAVFGE